MSLNKKEKKLQRFWVMLILVVSGEAIFFLPFVLARVFRPTFLAVFEINNFELGLMFSVYGTIAMISYFFGGLIADRFAANKLMSVALATTSVGGLIMVLIPGLNEMKILYGFWGITTILLFWAALIKATRNWGGHDLQGRAFGFLDGGRGLTAAITGALGVMLFAALLPIETNQASPDELKKAFQGVILFVSILTFSIAISIWFLLPSTEEHVGYEKQTFKGLNSVLKLPVVWFQAVIVICAYVGYKITDDFSLFASDVLAFDDVESAKVGTMALWIRPIAAVAAGLLADRVNPSRMIFTGFILTFIGSLMIGTGMIDANIVWFYFLAIITTSTGVYACRSLYFAMMEEGNIPLVYTGTAVGIISVVGYTPDIFIGPLMGYLLDSAPGAKGHQNLFLMLGVFSIIGYITVILFRKASESKQNS